MEEDLNQPMEMENNNLMENNNVQEKIEEIARKHMNEKMRMNYQNICNEFIYNCVQENNGKVSIKQLKQKFSLVQVSTKPIKLIKKMDVMF